jgi:hypothetical protein
MPLGTDDDQVAGILAASGVSQEDLTAAELDLTIDAQLLNAPKVAAALSASTIVARGPDDDAANTVIRFVARPSTVQQLVLADTPTCIRMARLADMVATRGATDFVILDVQQSLIDWVRETRHI